MKFLLSVLAFALCALPSSLHATQLAVLGRWHPVVAAKQVPAGAPLPSRFSSLSGAATLRISQSNGGAWRIFARQAANGRWHPGLQLSVRAVGGNFVNLSEQDTEILRGTGDRQGLPLQLQLSGLTPQVSPAEYAAGIIYTIVP